MKVESSERRAMLANFIGCFSSVRILPRMEGVAGLVCAFVVVTLIRSRARIHIICFMFRLLFDFGTRRYPLSAGMEETKSG
jgi:hypothetical protein